MNVKERPILMSAPMALAAAPAPAPGSVANEMREFAAARLPDFHGPYHMALVLSQKINEWADKLAAAPAPAPLTDGQILTCFDDAVPDYVDVSDAEMIDFARAIERAHGIGTDAARAQAQKGE